VLQNDLIGKKMFDKLKKFDRTNYRKPSLRNVFWVSFIQKTAI